MKKFFAAFLLFLAAVCFSSSCGKKAVGHDAVARERMLALTAGNVSILEQSCIKNNTGILTTRSYTFPDGDTVCFGRLETPEESCGAAAVAERTLAAETGVVTWYN